MNFIQFEDNRRVFVELGVLSSVPAILLLIHAIVPVTEAADFYFYPWRPSITEAWTAAMLHTSWKHVGSNSMVYVLASVPFYFVYYAWGRRQAMWVIFSLLLVSTPVIAGAFDVLVLRNYLGLVGPETNMKGFSGVSSAFVGMLLASTVFFINDRTESMFGFYVLFAVILLGFGIIAAPLQLTLTSALKVALAMGIGLLLVLYRGHQTFDLSDRDMIIRQVRSEDWEFELVVGGILIILMMIYPMFPLDSIAGETNTNIFAHFAGFVWGIVLTTLVLWSPTIRVYTERPIMPAI